MKITVLGCGSSGGVPLLGNKWGSCDPTDPRNRRSRVSVMVEQGDASIIIDTPPDLREQFLSCNVQRVTSVIYTHAHADHCHGIDELRSINWMMDKPIDIYADAHTMHELETRFPYIFHGRPATNNYYKPAVVPHIIKGNFVVDGLNVIPFEQDHGYTKSWGFRIGDFAYSTDAKNLEEAGFSVLAGIKVWVVDCVRETLHPTHSHLEQTLGWIKRVKPERAYLTHLNHLMDYATIAAKCPPGVLPAHDGLVIEC
jgi:phosphoribosyl 1,2-cyclic phosphate phosphodiesterase